MATVSNTKQLESAWMNAQPGETITVESDTPLDRITLKNPKWRPKMAPVVTIDLAGATVTRNPEVGSSDTLLLKSGVRDLVVKGGVLIGCSRSGIKTEGPLGARRIQLYDIEVAGNLVATSNDPPDGANCKWGAHHYLTGNWIEQEVVYVGIPNEHADYRHNIQGNHYFKDCSARWCLRTRLQVVNRMKEVDTPMPVGYGDVTIEDDYVEDVCLEDGGGGSAYTFRGGMPTSTVTLTRCTVRMGCNEHLALRYRKNITGALVMDSGPESRPGAGDAAWPGGTKALYLVACDFEVGTVWKGDRSCVKVEDCGLFVLNGTRIVVPRDQIALEIGPRVGTFVALNIAPDAIQGRVKFRGQTYDTWEDFADAMPADASGMIVVN